VVILIDEYDKPIIDYMDDIPQAEANRDILKNFYSVVKDADSYIRFFFVTGVSKFSQVSIFSDLNNLKDITLHSRYATMLGWTEEEVKGNFKAYLQELNKAYQSEDMLPRIREWYNGYSWDGRTRVYNPVSLMNVFDEFIFRNYWFSTGTPTFLMKYIKQEQYTAFDIETSYLTTQFMDKYEIGDINLIPLLFQTGYLTIQTYDINEGVIYLQYPNKEVELAFSEHMLTELVPEKRDKAYNLLLGLRDKLAAYELEEFVDSLNGLLGGIPYTLVSSEEKYFHSLFYLVVKILGFRINAEIMTIKGRIDAAIETRDYIFVLEFKVNQSAEKAIAQIREKGYADKYADDPRQVHLIGLNFDTEARKITGYKFEAYHK
jgi:hypothetical protein